MTSDLASVRVGSLFSGYGGLDLAVEAELGAETVWHAEIDPHASKILAARWPGVPNLGDITAVDWPAVAPVDVLTGGFPCQDLSLGGQRLGLRPGTRSGLWNHMAYAIAQLRPGLVVIENVRGLLSAGAHSDVEPCPWCLGDGEGEPSLRALGAVLGDLAGIGYDAAWHGLPASSVGAPHPRFRVFIIAWPAVDPPGLGRGVEGLERRVGTAGRGQDAAADAHDGPGLGQRACKGPRLGGPEAAADPSGLGHERRGGARDGRSGSANGGLAAADADHDPARDGREPDHSPRGRAEPAQRGGAAADPPCARLGGCEDAGADCGDALPGPRGVEPERGGAARAAVAWGDYEPAIRRWERVTGRPVPSPTEPGRVGQRLSPRFVEWLMGLPDGWVTDLGLGRQAELKALGNGVVPQQAQAALRILLPAASAAGAA